MAFKDFSPGFKTGKKKISQFEKRPDFQFTNPQAQLLKNCKHFFHDAEVLLHSLEQEQTLPRTLAIESGILNAAEVYLEIAEGSLNDIQEKIKLGPIQAI